MEQRSLNMPVSRQTPASHAAGLISQMKAAMNDAARNSALSRDQILDRMNQIAIAAGVRLTAGNVKTLGAATLEKWLNPAEREHVPGVLALNVFCAAVESIFPLQAQLSMHGLDVMTPQDKTERDYGRACLEMRRARKTKRKLEANL